LPTHANAFLTFKIYVYLYLIVYVHSKSSLEAAPVASLWQEINNLNIMQEEKELEAEERRQKREEEELEKLEAMKNVSVVQ
jgi:hypothetical protein